MSKLFITFVVSVAIINAHVYGSYGSKTETPGHSSDAVLGYKADGTPITITNVMENNKPGLIIPAKYAIEEKRAIAAVLHNGRPEYAIANALSNQIQKQLKESVNDCHSSDSATCGMKLKGSISIGIGGKKDSAELPPRTSTEVPATATVTTERPRPSSCVYSTPSTASEALKTTEEEEEETEPSLVTTEGATEDNTSQVDAQCIALDWVTLKCTECSVAPTYINSENHKSEVDSVFKDATLWCIKEDQDESVCFQTMYDCEFYYGMVTEATPHYA